MILGTVLVVLALSLFLKNQQEAQRAKAATQEALDKVWSIIYQRVENSETEAETAPGATAVAQDVPEAVNEAEDDPYAMTVVEIDGHGYVGSLSIPDLGLELPVLEELTDAQLEISPCRYYGSTKSKDLVIGAHNYISHFARIWRLKSGAEITFTDMDGKTFYYEVALVETLSPSDGDHLTDGEYPLTLFTCTYSGNQRTTVRCVLLEE